MGANAHSRQRTRPAAGAVAAIGEVGNGSDRPSVTPVVRVGDAQPLFADPAPAGLAVFFRRTVLIERHAASGQPRFVISDVVGDRTHGPNARNDDPLPVWLRPVGSHSPQMTKLPTGNCADLDRRLRNAPLLRVVEVVRRTVSVPLIVGPGAKIDATRSAGQFKHGHRR